MDLAYSLITEDGPRRLVFASIPGGMRYVFAAIFSAVALGLAYAAFQARTDDEAILRWLGILMYGVPAAVFLIVAIGIGFGRERLTIDADARSARLDNGLGPFNWSRQEALPASGIIRVEFHTERSGSTDHWTTSRHYTVTVKGLEVTSIKSINDRESALAIANRLATLLGYRVENNAEDDGVQRLQRGKINQP